MTKRERVRKMRLAELEDEFRPLLLSCLQQCVRGRWGLFGAYDHIDPKIENLIWPEAKRLKELASEIESIGHELGQTNETCERFLYFYSLRGSNVPGEPRLAAKFLAEIDET
jgi:hypothetical protein